MQSVLVRFLCATFVHINLAKELLQSFLIMKFALNHKWKFKQWRYAYFVGLSQMLVVFFVQLVNLGLIYSDGTALDIIKDFVSLIIIAELDDFYFMTVKEERLGQIINRGSIKLDDKELTLSELTKIETTSSQDATA